MEQANLKRQLALKYPGLYFEQKKDNAVALRGVVHVNSKWIRLKLYLPHFPELRDFHLNLQEHLEYKRYTTENIQIKTNWQLDDLLLHIAQLKPKEPISDDISNQHKSNIYTEILDLHNPQEYRLQLNDRFTRIRFCGFIEHEAHYLELELPSLRLIAHSLPECIQLEDILESNSHSLTDILHLYLKLLEELRPFYDSFSSIDELCDVLQPCPITTKDNTRVFPLKERVYLKLTIADPFASYASMAVQIIGPTEEVVHLRHVLSDGLGNWDIELDMHKNLLHIFDMCYFPMPAEDELKKDNDEQQRCNICFEYRLDNGEVPLVSCDNSRCVLKCHASCLKEWFDTLVEGKTFLEVSFGQCPFCKAKLSTSFAVLLKN
ncbi:hypothetical protein AWZ03_005207 [Drosophila navojoa]|uniref:RING-type domain-containing protein n=1 Tax=Drosophila navojoa TaxID=7232 RepID=A0A484BJS8_DRONA|nr:uncharacterized protein LOC108659142 [Drosophila navojoa]TDG48462.1 hypothetical protein AWZ03_005207 [Drosophila navojoa]